MPPSLKLKYIDGNHVFTDYTFEKTFEISRSKKNYYGVIILSDTEVSGKHCTVHCINDMGFFLQDEGSTNHTFIKLNEKSNFALKKGMEILMGETIFEVTEMLSDKIQLKATVNYEEQNPEIKIIEIKLGDNLNDIVFGRNPAGKYKYQFEYDKNIDDEHAIFRKLREKFFFCPLRTTNRFDFF